MEAMQLDPNQELKEMVFSVQTNYIFKEMLKNVSKSYRQRFVKELRVDVQTIEPIYFNSQRYKSKDHKDSYFLFIDKDFRLIGMLKGSSWDKDWENYEAYSMKRNWHNEYSRAVIKNRTNMQDIATHILMVTPEMKAPFKKRVPKKGTPRFIDRRIAYRDLQGRLKKFKLRKHKEISNDQIMEICKKLITYFTQHMFDPEMEKILIDKKPSSRWFSINNISELIKDVADLSSKFHERLNEYNGTSSFSRDWAYRELTELRVEIINYKNAYFGEDE